MTRPGRLGRIGAGVLALPQGRGERQGLAFGETPRRPRGLPRVSLTVWGVSTSTLPWARRSSGSGRTRHFWVDGALERIPRRHQPLHALDGAFAVEGEGDVEVEDGAAGGAAGGDAQAEADVLQGLALLLQRAVARSEGIHEPGLAGVEEDRGAEMGQVEDLAVAVEALLRGQQEAAV